MKHLLILGVLIPSLSLGQEHEGEDPHEHAEDHHEFKHHRLALIIGHGHVFGAKNPETGKEVVTIPTWGFDYQYWINHKFGVGLKTDVEIMEYTVQASHSDDLDRKNPWIISTVFLYHPAKGWNFLIGAGIELEEQHNLFIIRGGVAYEFEFRNHWDFSPEVILDLKDGSIGAMTWGIGVGKRF